MKLSARVKKTIGHPYCSAVVLAAGEGRRMGCDKIMLELAGEPVILHTLRVMQACACLDEIVVVCRPEQIPELARLCREHGITKASKVIAGGDTRLASALAGVSETARAAKLIAIHDGARPLVTPDIVERTAHMAALHQAAAPAIPLKDTVKTAREGRVVSTLDRGTLAAVQTPQIFQAELIKGALTNAYARGEVPTDDCAAVEAMGAAVCLTEGSDENIKLTTPTDVLLAEAILQRRRER